MSATPNRTLAALGAVLIYACVIAFTDNYVRVIAADGGLWQFHATRTAITEHGSKVPGEQLGAIETALADLESGIDALLAAYS